MSFCPSRGDAVVMSFLKLSGTILEFFVTLGLVTSVVKLVAHIWSCHVPGHVLKISLSKIHLCFIWDQR